MHADGDLILAAATAAGKTEAAFLPLISQVHEDHSGPGFDLVYIGPLRALINDQFRRLEDLCEALKMKVHPWHGDIPAIRKRRARENPRGILLITPESLEALFVLRGVEIPRLFATTRAIVIDELHDLLDSERGVHLRSLLTRMELAVGRRIRRIGLSATLGDMALASAYLRPEAPDRVEQLISRAYRSELRVELRAYASSQPADRTFLDEDEDGGRGNASAPGAVGEHIFENFRGQSNLVFAGSRREVESYSDVLRTISERKRIPVEFFPHYSGLTREHRNFVEKRLKEGKIPTTAVCTSTLELGIDIGSVDCVGHIGPPWSVASLRQRLGRTGRRPGQPAVLRMYAVVPQLHARLRPVQLLQLGLVRSIAMIDLLVDGWCEPPAKDALHLSTLTHQILSVITERGGASAQRLYDTLCIRGPFRTVDTQVFASLLRQLGSLDNALIEQASDGSILLGRQGERIVEHYSFYAAFQTPQEFRVVHRSTALGTIPVTIPLSKGMTIILVGKRWRIEFIHFRERTIEVETDTRGAPPIFGGYPGAVHDTVVQRMRDVLSDEAMPPYLDSVAQEVLIAAKAAYRQSALEDRPLVRLADDRYLLATWTGTIKSMTLAIVLTALGNSVEVFDGMLEVSPLDPDIDLVDQLKAIATGQVNLSSLVKVGEGVLEFEKFHRFLNTDLLAIDALSTRLDLDAVPEIARLCVGPLD